MKPTQINFLLRPWQTYRNGEIFYGMLKTGNKRWSLTTKQGNKTFYKGTGSSGVGRWTTRGRYIVNWEKVRTYVVPSGIDTTQLKPLVCATAPKVKHTFRGYQGPMDGKLYVQKVKDFIKYGVEESPESARNENFIERG
ncbi:mitochondrial 54S ribosomal protein YmL27 [Sugiyamaella lignohabitans]|uniref:Mitochondrial 54S ribosomal protein YmL27 n=1 Tax=Sugiyamaella lignohabitans TaxID=796027 RepID=A0A161HLA3_9ASCO|nr:mitochondrial 54S ribosomal protein YmL27 [Sugiyamaella lignohabitans]ANB12798.1 mitochondrial 54S ribosomal protein YmL27 [Sugiyamaella lignohabitans]